MIMMVEWLSVCVCYFLIGLYIKYIPGNIFVNTTFSSLSEAASNILTFIFLNKFGPRKTLFLLYAISTVTAILLVMAETFDLVLIVPFLVLGSRFGVAAAFSAVYMVNVKIFPTEYQGTIFGICNLIGRFSTIFAPFVAEMPSPTPLIVFAGLCGLSSLTALKLQEKKE